MTALDALITRNQAMMSRLMQMIRGDIQGALNRATSMDDFLGQVGINLNTNIMNSDAYIETVTEIIRGITEAYDLGAKGLPIGGMREVYRETAQQHTMDLVTKMGEDMKQQMRDILSQDLADGKGMRDIAQDLMNNVDGMSRSRAEVIARTETVRDKNLGQWYAAKDAGKKAFIVISAFDCCEICEEEYVGKTFDIDDVDMLPPLHPNCYDKETEVYTSNGWKLFKDVEETDLILSIHPETHEIEFVPFKQRIEYHYKGNLIHFKNKWFDMMVTPDHQMYVATRPYEDRKKYYWHFREAKNVKSTCHILRTAKWNSDKELKLIFDPDDFAYFMGWWLSEGYIVTTRDSVIGITQNDEAVLVELQDRLQKMFGDFTNVYKTVDRVEFRYKELYDYLSQFGKSDKKYIPEDIKQLPQKYIKTFLDAYLRGDGSQRVTHSNFKNITSTEKQFFTSSKRMADDLSELILKIGGYPSIKLEKRKGKITKFKNGEYEIKTDIYYIRWNNSKLANVRNMAVTSVPYDDMVYCLELEKNHILWVKRNGKTGFSGNCGCTAQFFRTTDMADDMASSFEERFSEEQPN